MEDKTKLSVPDEKTLYGVKIKKMPTGKYIKALRLVKKMPTEFIEQCLQGKTQEELFEKYKNLDLQGLIEIFVNLIDTLPDFIFDFLTELLDIPREKIEDELTPAEVVEILITFWEVNRLNDFFTKIKEVGKVIPV